MQKMTFPLTAAVMTAAIALSSPALGESPQKPMGMNMPVFADCDLDGDGSITEKEFLKARAERIAKRAQEGRQMKNVANAPSFQDIDTNDDDAISPDEFAVHQAEHKAKMNQG